MLLNIYIIIIILISMEAEKGTPTLRRTRSEISPKSPPKLRRCFAEVTFRSFAELSSEASPKSPPKLRRTQLRSFADASPKSSPKLRRIRSEASPKSLPKIRRSILRTYSEVSSEAWLNSLTNSASKGLVSRPFRPPPRTH